MWTPPLAPLHGGGGALETGWAAGVEVAGSLVQPWPRAGLAACSLPGWRGRPRSPTRGEKARPRLPARDTKGEWRTAAAGVGREGRAMAAREGHEGRTMAAARRCGYGRRKAAAGSLGGGGQSGENGRRHLGLLSMPATLVVVRD